MTNEEIVEVLKRLADYYMTFESVSGASVAAALKMTIIMIEEEFEEQ